MPEFSELLGIGVYTIPEAAMLSKVSTRTIRRWVGGYSYQRSGGLPHLSPPIWRQQIPPRDGEIALSFRDLLEVRFVSFFRKAGVSWKKIRVAAECAEEMVRDSHPFSTKRFKTDGKSIYAEIAERTGEDSLIDLATRQYELKAVTDPFLFGGIEFEATGIAPVRWWPLGEDRRVVIDPRRSFGQPICHPESVPTSVLARAFEAERSVEVVSRWHGVDVASVEDAVEFENSLRAA